MSSAAAQADLPPHLPRPSVFISYASEDRAPTRLLRDALEAAGLDVWYDENELGGGDAWDQKIRRQIRECTYFMPVISAQTEARREGYFRREWRLAVDRSHDMADDVMFLLPVVIDGTGENGARVPEKFLTVQWLKVPGGIATPALTALAARLAHGEHVAPTAATPRPTFVPPPVAKGIPVPPIKVTLRGSDDAQNDGPPPMPPFPPRPADQRDNLKYFAEIFWWVLSTAWLLFKRLPKWARVLLIVWAVITLFSFGSKDDPEPRRKTKTTAEQTPPSVPAAAKTVKPVGDFNELKTAAKKLDELAARPDTGNLGAGFARAGAELARAIAKEVAPPAAEPISVVPFQNGIDDPAARKLANDVFTRVFSHLAVARPGQLLLLPTADPAAGDRELRNLAQTSGTKSLLVARIETEGAERSLVVRVLAVQELTTTWTARYPLRESSVVETAGQISQALLALLPTTPTTPATP
jgi:hypothetical protein